MMGRLNQANALDCAKQRRVEEFWKDLHAEVDGGWL